MAIASFGYAKVKIKLTFLVMWFVYVVKSIGRPFIYIGSTNDLERRLSEHNAGMSLSTKHYAPFEIEAYVAAKN